MYAININFGTGRRIAPGLREDFVWQGGDLRPIDAPEYIPTGSHEFLEAHLNDRLYYVMGEQPRDKPY